GGQVVHHRAGRPRGVLGLEDDGRRVRGAVPLEVVPIGAVQHAPDVQGELGRMVGTTRAGRLSGDLHVDVVADLVHVADTVAVGVADGVVLTGADVGAVTDPVVVGVHRLVRVLRAGVGVVA